MKRLFLFLLLFCAFQSFGQLTVTVMPSDTVACYHDSIVFRAELSDPGLDASYKWLKNGQEIPFIEDSLLIFPAVTRNDTAFYMCIATYGTDTDTSNIVHLGVHEEIVFDTLYRYNELGCPGICKGQFKTRVSGGLPPYIYTWGGGFSQDTLVFGLCPGYHTLTITDMRGCTEDSVYFVDALKLPKVTFDVLPSDTVYLTNPAITMQFPDTARPYMVNWDWTIKKAPDTTVIYNAPDADPGSYIFDSTGTFQVYLSFTDLNGCDSTMVRDVIVKVAQLKISGAITPNGDNSNEYFEVRVLDVPDPKTFDYRTVYLGTELLVWDRWGKKVFSQKDYQSGTWDGENLSDGVYFYLLKCDGQWEDEVYRGTLTILREAKQ